MKNLKQKKYILTEAYKSLRTNIQYSNLDSDIKIIVVTSSLPGEGKSTTACNLARTFAQSDKKVLLIDCDLRKPSVHKRMKISNLVGLTDILIGKKDVKNTTHKYSNHLDVIPAGKIPPNPAEMVSSKSMSMLLNRLSGQYDYIIIDSPPLLVVTDAKLLATKADGVVLVVKSNTTKKPEIKSSINSISEVRGNLLGIVLNGVNLNEKKYYYYY